MRAGLRWTIAVVAAGLALGPAPSLAQDSADTPSDAPATDAVGPRELQNFNLQGTVTRPAEPSSDAPASNQPATSPPPTSAETVAPEQRQAEANATSERRGPVADREAIQTAVNSAVPRPGAASPQAVTQTSSVTVPLPPAQTSLGGIDRPGFSDSSEPTGTFAPEHRPPLWPWLLAALALGGGGAFLFWRNHHPREALAGGPQVEAFVGPESPAPRPRLERRAPAALPPAPEATAAGLVSTRLRPWIEIELKPGRCIVEDQQVTFEFELGLYNSGSGPARDVLIEACMINASPDQEQEITNFFENPVGQGERIPTIPPLKRADLKPRVAVTRDQLRVLDAGGRKVFVPVLAFNALYRWGSGSGQSSGTFLLGRSTKGEKLAPFRLDLGPRVFRGVEARQLPLSVRN